MNVDYPLHFDERGRTAQAAEHEHVRDLLEQLLFTNPGERVNRPDFGSGLLQLVFAPNSPELAAALRFTTQAAIQRYLGDVLDLRQLDVQSDEASLRVSVQYALRRNGELHTAVFERSQP